MKSILDPDFKYVPSASTDVRRTFERIRREMRNAGTATPREAEAHRRGTPIRHATERNRA